jgi:NTP pyrophosphatase (non-canonical NTP hydrolase)
MDVRKIQDQIAAFVKERDWDPFHSPKNLSMALAGEAAELLEHFQWLTEEESRSIGAGPKLHAIGEEVADVLIYALRLADRLGIDVEQAIEAKMKRNAENYPVETSRGSIRKHSQPR